MNKEENKDLQKLEENFNFLRNLIKDYILPLGDCCNHPWFIDEKEIQKNFSEIDDFFEKGK